MFGRAPQASSWVIPSVNFPAICPPRDPMSPYKYGRSGRHSQRKSPATMLPSDATILPHANRVSTPIHYSKWKGIHNYRSVNTYTDGRVRGGLGGGHRAPPYPQILPTPKPFKPGRGPSAALRLGRGQGTLGCQLGGSRRASWGAVGMEELGRE